MDYEMFTKEQLIEMVKYHKSEHISMCLALEEERRENKLVVNRLNMIIGRYEKLRHKYNELVERVGSYK